MDRGDRILMMVITIAFCTAIISAHATFWKVFGWVFLIGAILRILWLLTFWKDPNAQ